MAGGGGGLPRAPAVLVLQAEGGWGDVGSPRSPRTPRGPAQVLAAMPEAPGGMGKVPLGLLVALEHAAVPIDGRRSSLIRFGPAPGETGVDSTLVAFRHLGREVLLVLVLPASVCNWEGEAAALAVAEAVLTMMGSCAAWQGRATRAALEQNTARVARRVLHGALLNLFGPRYSTHPLTLCLPDRTRAPAALRPPATQSEGRPESGLGQRAGEALWRLRTLLHKEALAGRVTMWVQTLALFHEGTLVHAVEDEALTEPAGPGSDSDHLRAIWAAVWALRLHCRGPQSADLLETLEVGALEGVGLETSGGDSGSEGPAIAPRTLVLTGCGEDLLCCLFRPGHPSATFSGRESYMLRTVHHTLEALRGSLGGSLGGLLAEGGTARKPGARAGSDDDRPTTALEGGVMEVGGAVPRAAAHSRRVTQSGVVIDRWVAGDTVHEALIGPSESELHNLRYFYAGLLQEVSGQKPRQGQGPNSLGGDSYTGLAEGARGAQLRAEELQAGDPQRFPLVGVTNGLEDLEEVLLFAGPPGCPLGARASCRLTWKHSAATEAPAA